jgi:hypothetical protein
MVVSLPSALAAATSSALGSAKATALEAITMAVESESRRRKCKVIVFSFGCFSQFRSKLILGSDEANVTIDVSFAAYGPHPEHINFISKISFRYDVGQTLRP